MERPSPPPESETHWIDTTRGRNHPSFVESFAGPGAVPNSADVDRIGIGPEGVTFDRAGESTSVAWGDLTPSEHQWKGMLVLGARDGTPPEGGPWTVDAHQGREILSDPRWPDPEYSQRAVATWLTQT